MDKEALIDYTSFNNIIDLYGEVDWDDIDNNVNKYAGIGT